MPSFTEPQITETLRDILFDYGQDHVYQYPTGSSTSCFYRSEVHAADIGGHTTHTTGAPSCLIGQLLDRLGVLPETLGYDVIYSRDHGLVRCEGLDAAEVFSTLDVELPDFVGSALRVLQGKQDIGETWGIAAWAYVAELGLDWDEFIFDVPVITELTVTR